MTAHEIDLDILKLPSAMKSSSLSPEEKKSSRRVFNQDPRMLEFVKKIIALQSNGELSLALGRYETEEELSARRDSILNYGF